MADKGMDLSIPQHFTKEQSDWIKAYCINRNKEFYNKAIDNFVHECDKYCGFYNGKSKNIIRDDILKIAEELKKQNKYTDDKQMSKKPIFDFNYSDTLSKFHCPCGNNIKVHHDIGIMDNNDAPNYCSNCGQKLDWSE